MNFDWDERFQLDLLNNMEVEFLIYSWDPQLRHRLCYRTSLRLGNLFGQAQRYHQVALRLHPAGVVYLTVRYTQLAEAYNRSTNTLQPGPLFGTSIDSVVETENSGFLVPLLVKRCIQVYICLWEAGPGIRKTLSGDREARPGHHRPLQTLRERNKEENAERGFRGRP